MSSKPPPVPQRHAGKRMNSGQPATQSLNTRHPHIWFHTGQTFHDTLIGRDEATYRDPGERPPLRPTRFIPVMEKWFAALYHAADPPPSAHQLIITIDPVNEKKLQLKMEFELAETGETVTELFELPGPAGHFQPLADAPPLHQLRLLFVFGSITEVEDIDYGELCLIDVTDETPHGFVPEVRFSCDVIPLEQSVFPLVELMPDIEITDSLAQGE